MAVDLKKEIKLSDLIPRRSKAGKKPPPEKPAPKPKRRKDAAAPAALPSVPLMRAFNLMPGEEARAGSGGRRLALPQVAVALLALLVVAGTAGAYMLMSARVADKQDRLDDLRAQLAEQQVPEPGPQGQPEQETVDPALEGEAQARTAALAGALSSRVAWDRVLRELSLVLPEDVWLTSLSAGAAPQDAAAPAPEAAAAAAGGPSVTLSGFSRDPEGVALLLSRLEVIPEFSEVTLESSERAEGGSYSFSIAATLAGGGSGEEATS